MEEVSEDEEGCERGGATQHVSLGPLLHSSERGVGGGGMRRAVGLTQCVGVSGAGFWLDVLLLPHLILHAFFTAFLRELY